MKNSSIIPLILAVSTGMSVFAQDKTVYILAQKYDMLKAVTYEVVTEAQFAEMNKGYQAKFVIFSKAVSAAEKEWRTDATLKMYAFPRSSLAAPRIMPAGKFDSEEKAKERLEMIQKKLDAEKAKAEELKAKQEEFRKKKEENKKGQNQPKKETKDKTVRLEMEQLVDNAALLVEKAIEELSAPKQEEIAPE